MNHKPLREEIDKAILENVEWNSFAIDYVWNGSPERLSKKIISLLKSRLLKALPKEKGLVEDFGEEGELNLTLTKIHSGYNQALKELREAIKGVLDGK